MLSQSAEYALRAVVALAEDPSVPQTTRELASRTGVPAGYLSKILQALGRAGLVIGQRGLGGGFRLSRPPARITALDVVTVVSPLRRIVRCPVDEPNHRHELCALHRRLDGAYAHVEAALRETRIDALLDHPAGCRPLSVAKRKSPGKASTNRRPKAKPSRRSKRR